MNIDLLLTLIATGLRIASEATGKGGLRKLSTEFEAMAAKTDAFRTDPVIKAEIDAARLKGTW